MLEKKKNNYKEQIHKIAKESFNNEQKNIACQIIDSANEHNIDAVYQLISQRVKTGFVFDAAPEVNHDCVALIKENKKLHINPDELFNEHVLIIGENYDVLKNLLVTYIDPKIGKGLIDIIYIDPPYGTEKASEEGNDYKEEVESNKFIYRDKFTRDGWLNMMNERLILSKKLLSDSGLIFISIDDSNQAYLKVLLDEIFGENNFVATFIIDKTAQGANQSKTFKMQHEYLICYAKDSQKMDLNYDLETECDEKKYKYKDNKGYYAITNAFDSINSPLSKNKNRGYTIYYNEKESDAIIKDEYDRENETFGELDKELIKNGYTPIRPSIRNNIQYPWNWERDRFLREYKTELEIRHNTDGKLQVYHKNRFSGLVKDTTLKTFDTRQHGYKVLNDIFGAKVFDYPKSVQMMKWLLTKHNNKDAIVLDFFAGSGTTGQAVMELNQEDGGKRKFILATNNENNIATEITWERLYRIIKGKGSKGEKINWVFSKDKKTLSENRVTVFDINYYELKLNDFDKARKLIPIAEAQFLKINPIYKPRDKFDIYNELSALNPYKEE